MKNTLEVVLENGEVLIVSEIPILDKAFRKEGEDTITYCGRDSKGSFQAKIKVNKNFKDWAIMGTFYLKGIKPTFSFPAKVWLKKKGNFYYNYKNGKYEFDDNHLGFFDSFRSLIQKSYTDNKIYVPEKVLILKK